MRPLRSAGGTLTSVSGTLLSPRLLAAAADFRTGEGGLSALTLIGQVVDYGAVQDGRIGGDTENGIGQIHGTGLLTGHIKSRYCSHCLFPPSLTP